MKNFKFDLILVLGLILLIVAGEQYLERRGYARAKAEDRAEIERIKREAATQLDAEKDKVRTYERALQLKTDAQNLKDTTHEKTIADLSDRLRRASGPAGRLRDPHAPGCGAGGGSTTAPAAGSTDQGAENGTQAGGLLSVPLTELLNRIVREADDINIAYASCRADAYTVRASQP